VIIKPARPLRPWKPAPQASAPRLRPSPSEAPCSGSASASGTASRRRSAGSPRTTRPPTAGRLSSGWQARGPHAIHASPDASGEADAKRKKRKKGRETEEADDLSRRAGAKRKEIIEHDALYGKTEWDRGGRGVGVRVLRSKDRQDGDNHSQGDQAQDQMDDAITVADLAKKMGIRPGLHPQADALGVIANINKAVTSMPPSWWPPSSVTK
jgi:hypothetical protein